MTVKYTNNAETTLSSAVNTTDTIIEVVSVSDFPTLSVGDAVYLTISNPTNTLHEVVLCTAITGTSLTVTRGYDNTTALSWAVGSKVSSRLTAGLLQYLLENQASVTESQISDFGTYLTSETNTTISLVNNILTYTDENGVDTNIDLSYLLDDTNLVTSVDGQTGAVDLSTTYQPLEDQRVSTTDDVVFNSVQLSGGAAGEGILSWNTNDSTIDITMANGSVLQVGQELFFYVKADEAISNGDVVYASGAVGNSGAITVSKFTANNTIDEIYAIGVATGSIAIGEFGYITILGKVRDISTDGSSVGETWVDGTVLYPSATTAGKLTSVPPVAPNQTIPVATVVSAHATNGILAVRATSLGYHLSELHDVHIDSVANGEALVWNSTTGRWENQDAYVRNTGDTMTGDLTVPNLITSGLVDGRDVSVDGSKLDGIEPGATGDQSASEIKTAYESNADTNAYTDADASKLAGIEAGATADQTAAEILVAIKTVDGTGSGLDADTLDGKQLTTIESEYQAYANAAAAAVVDAAPTTLDTLNELAAALGDDPNFATTVSTQIGAKLDATANAVSASKLATARSIGLSGDVIGSANFDGSSNITITATVADDSHNHVISNVDGLQAALDGKSATTHNHTLDGLSNTTITSNTAGEILKWNGTAWVNNTLSEAGIQPAGSYQVAGTYNTVIGIDTDYSLTGANVFSGLTLTDGVIQGVATRAITLADLGFTGETNATADQTAAEILTAIKTVDGAGSGLDADLLDGQHGSYYYPASNPNGYTTNTGTVTSVATGGGLTGGTITGSGTISHADTSSQASVNNSGATVIQNVTLDTYGHVTGLASKTLTAADVGAAASSHTHNYAGADSSGGAAYDANAVVYTGYGSGEFTAYQTAENWQTWTGGWATHLIGNHGDGSTYYNQTIIMPFGGAPQYMRKQGGVDKGPYKFWTEENDGSGSGLDADLLDGQHGSYYYSPANAPDPTLTINGDASGSATFTNLGNATLTLAVADDSHNHVISNVDGLQTALDGKAPLASPTFTGTLTVPNIIATSNGTGTAYKVGDDAYIGDVNVANTMNVRGAQNSDRGYISFGNNTTQLGRIGTGALTWGGSTLWHAGNDGSGSGLDADLLDGQHGSYYYPASNPNGYTSNTGDITGVTAGSGITGGGTSGTVTVSHADTSTQASVNNSGATVIQDVTLDTYGHVTALGSTTLTLATLGYTGETNATADQTAAEILTAIKTVDGSGSGLDADLLDGQHGSYFYSPANPPPAAGSMTLLGQLNPTSGNSTTLSSLNLTGYTSVRAYWKGLKLTGSAYVYHNGYRACYTSSSSYLIWGMIDIDLASQSFGGGADIYTAAGAGSASAGRGFGGKSNLTTASTSITFTTSAGTFVSGSIRIYGVK